ncbi:MAG: oligosaccharide flippase family protein [Gammaproteobacteria bacterium]|nr:oligosaccharide flippase family protein [Gammaproteobacteria bacterium]
MLKRVVGNVALLLSGKAAAGLMTAAAIALMARALDPAGLGVLALLHAYVITLRGLLNLRLVESIVHYGVLLLDNGDLPALRRLLRFTERTDRLTSLIATVLGVALAPVLGPTLGWQPQHNHLAMLYSATLLFSANNASHGMLRICDRFDLLGWSMTLGPLVRLLGSAVAFFLAPSIDAFALAMVFGLTTEFVITNVFGGHVRRRRLAAVSADEPETPPSVREQFPDLPRFVAVVYAQNTLDMLPKQVSTLLAGVLLGPAGAALFQIAREFANVLAKPVVMLRQAVFPDLTRLWQRDEHGFRRLYLRLTALLGIPALLLVVVTWLLAGVGLRHLLGPDYEVAADLMTLLMLASAIELMAATMRPAGYAVNKAIEMLWIQVFAMALYVALFLSVTPLLGLEGPGVAACVATVLGFAGTARVVGAAVNARLRQYPPGS